MSEAWLDRIETALIYVLAGFLFWPNAVSSLCLIALVGIAFLRYGKAGIPSGKEWFLVVPPLLIIGAWLLHGAAPTGMMEVQLWATWIGALIFFKASPLRSRFVPAMALLSLAQALVVLVVFALGEPAPGGGFSQFLRDEVGRLFNVHPTYISAVWLWAGSWLILHRGWPWRYRLLALVVLVIMAMLFGGKMPFIAFVTVIGYIIVSIPKQTQKRLWMGGLLVAFVAFNVFLNPSLRQRFNELTSLEIEYTEGQWLSSTELRIGIWRCAVDVAGEHWLTGVGTGNTRRFLEACYGDYGQVEFFDTEFNSHNQYLHFWLTGGIGSFVIFLVFLWWLFREAIRCDHGMMIAFLIYASMLFLSENYFSRQAGMMFIAFTLMQLYFTPSGELQSASSSHAR